MILFIIRHGDPVYTPDSLTKKGRLQAEAVAKRLSVHGLDRIFVSPKGRARMTAQPTCDLLGIEPEIEIFMDESRAMDRFHVPTENGGRTWIMGARRMEMFLPENELPRDRWFEAPVFADRPLVKPGYDALIAESDDFMRRLGFAREGGVYRRIGPDPGRVACFCHAGFGCSWLSHLLYQPPQLFWRSFDINHSSVTILNFEGEELCAPMCLSLSDNSHIYADRLPLQHNNRVDL